MPNVHFESLSSSLARLPDVIKTIPDILRNPAANPLQAAVLLGIGLVLLLTILLSAVLVFMRPTADDEAMFSEAGFGGEDEEEAEQLTPEEQAELTREEIVTRRMTSLTVTSIVVLVLCAVWLVAGVTTSQPDVCTSCHANTIHDTAKGNDPHKSVKCVACHEGGGAFARVSVNVFTRLEHVALARNDGPRASAFGEPMASDACISCHREQIKGTYFNPQLKVKVSHAEPLAAGAQCVDCHVLKSGVVSAATVGMTSCLRCHDGKAARAECSECHVGDPSQAIRPKIGINDMAAVQVPEPQCTACHKDQTRCNNCHGIQMPHSLLFKSYGHARQGALDIWFNSGKTCGRCHYIGHNYCVKPGCHLVRVADGHPNPAWAKLHQKAPWLKGQQAGCACHAWNPYDHDGMIYCQICHATKPKSARP